MNLNEIWENLKSHRESKGISELQIPITIPNSFSKKEYKLTHCFVNSKSAFIGTDSEGKKYHIKIFGVPSYNQVKIIHKNLRLVNEHAEDLRIIEVIDIIDFFDTDRWILVLVTPYMEGFTIDEISDCCHEYKFHLPKETSIRIFLQILDAIQVASDKAVRISTLPDNIFLLKEPENSSFPFKLKILPTSLHLLSCGKSKLEKIYPKDLRRNNVDGNIWGAGLCLYAFLFDRNLSSLSCLIEYNDIERQEYLGYDIYKDEALKNILQFSIKFTKPTNFQAHPILQYWRLLLDHNWESIEGFNAKPYSAICTALTFENPIYKNSSARKLLELASENSNEVLVSLTKSDLIYPFIDICLYFDWTIYPDLINSILMILKEKVKSRTFKEKLVSMNFLLIFTQAIRLKAKQDLLFQFIQNFFEDNTLTILQIVKDEDLLKTIMEKPNKTPNELTFIIDTMSYYGPHSVELIKEVYENNDVPEKRIVQHIHEIPYVFKQEKSQLIIQLIQKILERNTRNQTDSSLDMMKTIVHILAEILVIPKLFQYHHVVGLCTSKSERKFLTELSRSRLLVRCRDCESVFCSICKYWHPETHDIQFVLYQNPISLCYTLNGQDLHTDIAIFQMPRYQQKITFVDSKEIIYKSLNCHFIGSAGMRITTMESLSGSMNESANTILYFEVKVNSAGLQENIEIGVDGTGIVYKSSDGGVYRHGKLVGKAPRFGSYDIVGIGVTGKQKVYITYHGMVVWPMIDCEFKGELRPLVVLGCDHCDVEIQMRNLVFQPTREISPNQEFFYSEVLKISETVLNILGKIVNKSFKKNQNDAKTKDLYDKYIELLKAIKKYDLIEKYGVKKSKLWPR